MSFDGRTIRLDVSQAAGTAMDIGHGRMVLVDTGMVMGQGQLLTGLVGESRGGGKPSSRRQKYHDLVCRLLRGWLYASLLR